MTQSETNPKRIFTQNKVGKKNENITVYEMTQVILLINEKAQELFNSVIKGSHTQQIKKNLSNTHKTQVPKIQFKDPYSDTSEI